VECAKREEVGGETLMAKALFNRGNCHFEAQNWQLAI
jgi:hypothetical protein